MAIGLSNLPKAWGDESCYAADFSVAVDIGHTSANSGTISARGVPEYQFNLAMADVLLRELHEKGFRSSFLINADKEGLSLRERGPYAEQRGAALLLSIHHDSVQPRYLDTWSYGGRQLLFSDHAQGFSLFYSEKNPSNNLSIAFASYLARELKAKGFEPSLHHAEPIVGENRELLDKEKGIYRFDDLIVLKSASIPTILIEVGVIVNRDEEAMVTEKSYRRAFASAIVNSVWSLCKQMQTAP